MTELDPLARVCAVCGDDGAQALTHQGSTLCWLCSSCIETGIDRLGGADES
jgi:hypothetical protein